MTHRTTLWLIFAITIALSGCTEQDPPAVVACMNASEEQAFAAARRLTDYFSAMRDETCAPVQCGSAAAEHVAALAAINALRDDNRILAMVRAECRSVVPAK